MDYRRVPENFPTFPRPDPASVSFTFNSFIYRSLESGAVDVGPCNFVAFSTL